jgi:hypothetical protein
MLGETEENRVSGYSVFGITIDSGAFGLRGVLAFSYEVE